MKGRATRFALFVYNERASFNVNADMKRTFAISIFIGTLAAAQEPPILIRMIREPMRVQATERASNYLGLRVGTPILATTATTGMPETVFFEIHESYASLEAVDAVSHLGKLSERSAPFSTLLLHLPGLSFRPDLAAKLLPRARYLQISTYRIRPGTGAEFGDLMRLRRAAYDAINLDRPEMAYQVVSGTSSGTYVMIAPLTSLKTLDNGSVRNPAYAAAMGDTGPSLRKIASEIELSRDHQLLRLDPEWSYVSTEFAELSAENFWRPKFSAR